MDKVKKYSDEQAKKLLKYDNICNNINKFLCLKFINIPFRILFYSFIILSFILLKNDNLFNVLIITGIFVGIQFIKNIILQVIYKTGNYKKPLINIANFLQNNWIFKLLGIIIFVLYTLIFVKMNKTKNILLTIIYIVYTVIWVINWILYFIKITCGFLKSGIENSAEIDVVAEKKRQDEIIKKKSQQEQLVKDRETEKYKKAKEDAKLGKIDFVTIDLEKIFFSSTKPINCLICGERLSTDYDYRISHYGTFKHEPAGVYVVSNYSNEVKQAIEYKSYSKEFLATRTVCPHCKYELFEANVGSYKKQTHSGRDTNGEYYSDSEMTYIPSKIYGFKEGLLDKTKFKNVVKKYNNEYNSFKKKKPQNESNNKINNENNSQNIENSLKTIQALKELSELKDKGVLTEEEFQIQKNNLLKK